MARPTQGPQKAEEERQNQTVDEIRSHIMAAAALLRALGPQYSKVSWMLEDTLTYVEQAQGEMSLSTAEILEQVLASSSHQEREDLKGILSGLNI